MDREDRSTRLRANLELAKENIARALTAVNDDAPDLVTAREIHTPVRCALSYLVTACRHAAELAEAQ